MLEHLIAILGLLLSLKVVFVDHSKQFPYQSMLGYFVGCLLSNGILLNIIDVKSHQEIFLIMGTVICGVIYLDAKWQKPLCQSLVFISTTAAYFYNKIIPQLSSTTLPSWIAHLLIMIFVINAHCLMGFLVYRKMLLSFRPHEVAILMAIAYLWSMLFVEAIKQFAN